MISRLTQTDKDRLRTLAQKVRDIAESDRNKDIKRRFYAMDKGESAPPLILTETDGGLKMVMPDIEQVLLCNEGWARVQEAGLLSTIIHAELIGDDSPVEPFVNVEWHITTSGFGVETHQTRPETDGTLGAFHIDPPITDLVNDLDRLKPRKFDVNREASLQAKALLEEVYDGILGVRMRGNPWWSLGMTWTAIDLIGLDGLMLGMYDAPEALHDLMAYLRDDVLAFVGWLEREGLLSLNDENDYVGSGSRGYTHALPRPDRSHGESVKALDLWTLIESQETVGVGPNQFAEFIFPYQDAVAKLFGHVYYGCCEPVHTRWHVLKQMANIKRVSISPWCDQEFMADAMRSDYVFSRKPNPSLISTAIFDEDVLKDDLAQTMRIAKTYGCPFEIVMKDVHTLSGEPDRLTRWVKIAREVSREVYGE